MHLDQDRSNRENVTLSRRQFIAGAGALAALSLGSAAQAELEKTAPVRIGQGEFTYELVQVWGELPAPDHYGWGCGVVVDSKDRVYVHSRCRKAVAVFDRGGKLIDTFGAEYAGWGHGLYWSREGHDEFLYFTGNAPGNIVVKTDLTGKPVLKIGQVDAQSATSISFPFDNPTDVAIAPNGDIYVCEGYGSQLVHRFTKSGKHLQAIGGYGTEPDRFNICHGIWVDTRKHDYEIYVADRSNGRIQVFTKELQFKRSLTRDVRNPCCFYVQHGRMYIPDLDHRVTVFGRHDETLVLLGDGRGKGAADDPAVFHLPHALCLDSHGDMYVIEWVPTARLRKFRHTPEPARRA